MHHLENIELAVKAQDLSPQGRETLQKLPQDLYQASSSDPYISHIIKSPPEGGISQLIFWVIIWLAQGSHKLALYVPGFISEQIHWSQP